MVHGPVVKFRLSKQQLNDLNATVDDIDFAEADETLSSPPLKKSPAFLLSHDGTTVTLGETFTAINRGEGPEVADQIFDLLDQTEAFLGRPEIEKASDR